MKHAKVVCAVLISLYGPDKHVERIVCVRCSNSRALTADTSASQKTKRDRIHAFFFVHLFSGQSMDAGVLPHNHRLMNSDREIGRGDRDERIWPKLAKEGITGFL